MLSSYRALMMLAIINSIILVVGIGLTLYGMLTEEGFKKALLDFAKKYPDVYIKDVKELLKPLKSGEFWRGFGAGMTLAITIPNIIVWKAIRDLFKLSKVRAKVIKK